MPRVRHRSEAVDVDRGQFVHPSLKDCPLVMGLHELSPVGWWAPGRRDGWRLEWFAEVCQDLPDRPWLRDERDQPDVATTPGHSRGNSSPTRAISFAQAIREVSCDRGFA